jgi:hypothetical protein
MARQRHRPEAGSCNSSRSTNFYAETQLRHRGLPFEEERTMWALFYEGGQVSREYPNEAAVWRALRQAGMLDEDLFNEGYEVKQVEQEHESAFL